MMQIAYTDCKYTANANTVGQRCRSSFCGAVFSDFMWTESSWAMMMSHTSKHKSGNVLLLNCL